LPNIKSSVKSIKRDQKRHLRNLAEKDRIKKARKNLLEAIEKNDVEEAKKLLSLAHKALDQAAANNTIHKNAAARQKIQTCIES